MAILNDTCNAVVVKYGVYIAYIDRPTEKIRFGEIISSLSQLLMNTCMLISVISWRPFRMIMNKFILCFIAFLIAKTYGLVK